MKRSRSLLSTTRSIMTRLPVPVAIVASLGSLLAHAVHAQLPLAVTPAPSVPRPARLSDGSTLALSFEGWDSTGQPKWRDEQDLAWSAPESRELDWGQGLAMPRGAIVRLIDGSLIVGQVRDLDAESLRLATRWWPELDIPRSQVASTLLRPRRDFTARQSQEQSLAIATDQDRCWLEGNDWIDGTVMGLTPSLAQRPRGSLPAGFMIEIAERTSTVGWERVVGIHFAKAKPFPTNPVGQRLRTQDGSLFNLSRVEILSAGIVFTTASGWQLPPLPERQLKFAEIIGLSLHTPNGTSWPSADPVAAVRVPVHADAAADTLGARPAWKRQSVQWDDEIHDNAIVIEATATVVWKHGRGPGTLSLRLGLLDPHSPATLLQLFKQEPDGAWGKTPFWTQTIQPGEITHPLLISLPETQSIAFNVAIAPTAPSPTQDSTRQAPTNPRVALMDPLWHPQTP